jgi:phospholipid N-methyltransferase
MNSWSTPVGEFAQFARTWFRSPRKLGAIAPSGPSLARTITAEISHSTGNVLELGPGTGVFTRMLVERGVPEARLTLLENDPRFAGLLRERFPVARIISGCATALEGMPVEDDGFGAVVSGLPLLSMKPLTVQRILNGVFRHLQAEKAVYQFTYRPVCPVPAEVMRNLDLESAMTGFSLRNLPPAWVFALRRRRG